METETKYCFKPLNFPYPRVRKCRFWNVLKLKVETKHLFIILHQSNSCIWIIWTELIRGKQNFNRILFMTSSKKSLNMQHNDGVELHACESHCGTTQSDRQLSSDPPSPSVSVALWWNWLLMMKLWVVSHDWNFFHTLNNNDQQNWAQNFMIQLTIQLNCSNSNNNYNSHS